MTQFFYLLRWNYLRQKNLFILFTLAQVLLSVSLLFGYPLVIGKMDTTTAYYLASGSVLMGVISIGCTISSPVIANAKSEGHVDYIRALPIPRILISLADLCIWLIAILPGVFFSFLLGCLRFSVQLNLSILSVFVMLLIFNCLYIFPKYCHANVSAYFNDWSYVFTYHVSGKSSSRLARSTLLSTSICPFCESS